MLDVGLHLVRWKEEGNYHRWGYLFSFGLMVQKEILRGSGALGEDVEKGGLAHVGNANDSDPQIGTDPSDQRLALRLVVLLRRHFWIIWRVWESSILVNIFNLFLSIFGSRGGHNLTRRSPLVLTSCGAALLLGKSVAAASKRGFR